MTWWNDADRGKSKTKETYPSGTMPTTYPTWTGLGITGAPAMRRRWEIAWAMARSPVIYSSKAYLMTISIHVTLKRVRATRCYSEKATSIYTFWVCVCSLSYPICSAHGPNCHLWPALPSCFSTLSHKRHDFRRNITEHKMWELILSANCFWNTSHS